MSWRFQARWSLSEKQPWRENVCADERAGGKNTASSPPNLNCTGCCWKFGARRGRKGVKRRHSRRFAMMNGQRTARSVWSACG